MEVLSNQKGSLALGVAFITSVLVFGLVVHSLLEERRLTQQKIAILKSEEGFYAGEVGAKIGMEKTRTNPLLNSADEKVSMEINQDLGSGVGVRLPHYFPGNSNAPANLNWSLRTSADGSKQHCSKIDNGASSAQTRGVANQEPGACIWEKKSFSKCIDFEKPPGSEAFTESQKVNLPVDTQYAPIWHVSFSLLLDSSNIKAQLKLGNGIAPIIARVNKDPKDIPQNPLGQDNQRAWFCHKCKSYKKNKTMDGDLYSRDIVGEWTLTQPDATHAAEPATLVISYDPLYPTDFASGHVVDLDAGEKWTITPLDIDGNMFVDNDQYAWTALSKAGQASDTSNGRAIPWAFLKRRPTKDIYFIKIDGIKPKKIFGFGFDQFCPYD